MSQFAIPAITKPFNAEICLPGSKSIALRQLAMAALHSGQTTLSGIPKCDDADAMLDCIARLGAQVEVTEHNQQEQVTVLGPINLTEDVTLDARMSGASTRLLIGLAALRTGTTTIDGHPSLRVRTNQPLFETLSRYGCDVQVKNSQDYPGLPVTIRGPLQTDQPIRIDGSLSSQYITALMTIAPLCPNGLTIEIEGALVSRPYLNITTNEMRKRGAEVNWISDQTLNIPASAYSGGAITVEGDATGATYFAALATLHRSTITLSNLGNSSAQGDYAFMQVMASLGAEVDSQAHQTIITGPAVLSALANIDMTAMPDAALTLIGMGMLLPQPVTITGLSTLHHKECDRLECSVTELQNMGVQVASTWDSITIHPMADLSQLSEYTMTTYHDHRMAMAFSMLGSKSGQLRVDDERVVDKTFPTYWEEYLRLV